MSRATQEPGNSIARLMANVNAAAGSERRRTMRRRSASIGARKQARRSYISEENVATSIEIISRPIISP